jgi:hypothetical protein
MKLEPTILGEPRGKTESGRRFLLDALILGGIWILFIAMINPVGEFPLNDDWNYGIAVQQILDQHDFRPPTASCPLFTHALWGALFCIPSGFSYETLRFSNQFAGYLGLLVAYSLIREFKGSRFLAIVTAITLSLNPCYLGISNTFMTDVSFTAIFGLAALFFVRALKQDSPRYIVFGTIASLIAILNRQLGLALPVGFAVAYVLKSGVSKDSLFRSIAPVIVCFGLYFSFNQWMKITGRTPVFYEAFESIVFERLKSGGILIALFRSSERVLLYLGWFLFPVFILVYGYLFPGNSGYRSPWRRLPWVVSFLLVSVSVSLWRSGINWSTGDNLLPRGGGWIYREGLGPFKLTDTFRLRLQQLDPIDYFYWFPATCFGLLGAAMLVAFVLYFLMNHRKTLSLRKMQAEQSAVAFLLAVVVIYFAPILLMSWFDRYLIPVFPVLAAFGASFLQAEGYREVFGRKYVRLICGAASCMALIWIGYLSIVGTRDYFTWNRLRWEIANELLAGGKASDPKQIDAGEEYNALSIFGEDHRMLPDQKLSEAFDGNRPWAITFGKMPGYSVVKEFPYSNGIPRGTRKLYLLQKEPSS